MEDKNQTKNQELSKQLGFQDNSNSTEASIERGKKTKGFGGLVGQEDNILVLSIMIAATKRRGERLGHILIKGGIGSGRKTLANAIAWEAGLTPTHFSINKGTTINELASVMNNLTGKEALVIQGIEELKGPLLDNLLSILRYSSFSYTMGKGYKQKTIQFDLPPTTIIAIATTPVHLSDRVIDSFSHVVDMQPYSQEDLYKYIFLKATELNMQIDSDAAKVIVENSDRRFVTVYRILRRINDFALVKGEETIDKIFVNEVMSKLAE